MDLEARKRFLINVAYCAVAAAMVYVIFRYALFWLMPFVVGFGVAFVLKPAINGLSRITHMKRKPMAALMVLLFYGTIGVAIAYGIFNLVLFIRGWVYQLPQLYMENVEPVLLGLLGEAEKHLSQLDPAWTDSLKEFSSNIIGQVTGMVSGLSKALLGFASGMAASLPAILISMLFTIISSFFIAMDYYKITSFIVAQFSEKHQGIIFDIKNYVVGTVFKMVTSYALIMFITFVEIYIGFCILRFDNAFGMAALIALVDILPVLGTGGVVIPWIIIEALSGDYRLAVGLLCLYLFVTVVRNTIEPKIVGTRVGLPPLIMLMCMFLGVKLFGALGIVILPFMAIVIKNLNDSGKIHVFNYSKESRKR